LVLLLPGLLPGIPCPLPGIPGVRECYSLYRYSKAANRHINFSPKSIYNGKINSIYKRKPPAYKYFTGLVACVLYRLGRYTMENIVKWLSG